MITKKKSSFLSLSPTMLFAFKLIESKWPVKKTLSYTFVLQLRKGLRGSDKNPSRAGFGPQAVVWRPLSYDMVFFATIFQFFSMCAINYILSKINQVNYVEIILLTCKASRPTIRSCVLLSVAAIKAIRTKSLKCRTRKSPDNKTAL